MLRTAAWSSPVVVISTAAPAFARSTGGQPADPVQITLSSSGVNLATPGTTPVAFNVFVQNSGTSTSTGTITLTVVQPPAGQGTISLPNFWEQQWDGPFTQGTISTYTSSRQFTTGQLATVSALTFTFTPASGQDGIPEALNFSVTHGATSRALQVPFRIPDARVTISAPSTVGEDAPLALTTTLSNVGQNMVIPPGTSRITLTVDAPGFAEGTMTPPSSNWTVQRTTVAGGLRFTAQLPSFTSIAAAATAQFALNLSRPVALGSTGVTVKVGNVSDFHSANNTATALVEVTPA